jgi:Rrf2 family nitric oxide-sensitive transcriptional repressor
VELTYYTDYALRALTYVGLHAGRRCTTPEIAETYGISENHLTKIVHGLARGGFIRTRRGKRGGLELARAPETITIGAVVRYMEGPFRPVECFRSNNCCPITGACALPAMLEEAFAQFLAVLDRHTLADLLHRRKQLQRQLFSRGRTRQRATPC